MAVELTALAKIRRAKDQREVTWDVRIANQGGGIVAIYELLTFNAGLDTFLGRSAVNTPPIP